MLAAQGREQDDVADAGAVGQQHHQAVNPDTASPGGRHAVLEGAHKVMIEEHGFIVAAGEPRAKAKMRASQLFHWLYWRGAKSFDDMTTIAKETRAKLAELYDIGREDIARGQISEDGTRICAQHRDINGKSIGAIYQPLDGSWIDQPGSMRITQILNEVTEPILAPLRSILPSMGMFDFTPIIAMLLLQLLEGLVKSAVGG